MTCTVTLAHVVTLLSFSIFSLVFLLSLGISLTISTRNSQQELQLDPLRKLQRSQSKHSFFVIDTQTNTITFNLKAVTYETSLDAKGQLNVIGKEGEGNTAPVKPDLKVLDTVPCRHFDDSSIQNIAVVGNGPLAPEQRQEIAQMDIKIRFNNLNSRVAGEGMDIWVLRYNGSPPDQYWGFRAHNGSAGGKEGNYITVNTEEEVGDAFAGARQGVQPMVLLMNGDEKKASSLQEGHTSLHLPEVVLYDIKKDESQWKADFGEGAMMSTGLLALKGIVSCKPSAKVNVFGFNWSPENFYAHNMVLEEYVVHQMLDLGQVVLHQTPCGGYRDCSPKAAAPSPPVPAAAARAGARSDPNVVTQKAAARVKRLSAVAEHAATAAAAAAQLVPEDAPGDDPARLRAALLARYSEMTLAESTEAAEAAAEAEAEAGAEAVNNSIEAIEGAVALGALEGHRAFGIQPWQQPLGRGGAFGGWQPLVDQVGLN